jgi:uncharacterized protein
VAAQSAEEVQAGASSVGEVVALWRYPIKSLAGEAQHTLDIDQRGAVHDRRWALVRDDGGIASGKTTRRFRKVPGLMRHRGSIGPDGVPVLTLADGRTARFDSPEIDDLVAEIAGPEWSIRPERGISHFDAGALHLITTATVTAISRAASKPAEVERLRPNIVLAVAGPAFSEDDWVGEPSYRERPPTSHRANRALRHGQPGSGAAPARRDVLKTIGRVTDVNAGVYADVLTRGTVGIGDRVVIRDGLLV